MLCEDSPTSATTYPNRDGQCIQEETGSKGQVALTTHSYILSYTGSLE